MRCLAASDKVWGHDQVPQARLPTDELVVVPMRPVHMAVGQFGHDSIQGGVGATLNLKTAVTRPPEAREAG